MYAGYVQIGATELVNTHRAVTYARNGGLTWVRGCSECESIGRVQGGPYTMPVRDNAPWVDPARPEGYEFLGVLGLGVTNADASMRDMPVTDSIIGGGYIGTLYYTRREMLVTAMLIGGSERAVDYGLEWVRGRDSTAACETTRALMYAACPGLSPTDCDDPACVAGCVGQLGREYRDVRITSGPRVTRRRAMTKGAMAVIDFTITAGDPGIYAHSYAVPSSGDGSVPFTDPVLVPSVFSFPGLVSVSGVAAPARPVLRDVPDRADWQRETVVVPAVPFGAAVAPQVLVATDVPCPDLRVTFVSSGVEVAAIRMVDVPGDATVRVDFNRRRVYVGVGGVEQEHPAFVTAPDGGHVVWPEVFPNTGYEVLVDRVPGSFTTVVIGVDGKAVS